MALAWFIAPYKRVNRLGPPTRSCAMNDFNVQILADGGTWDETEILGDSAIVKVRASAATLTAINAAAGMTRIPKHVVLAETLGDLTAAERNGILNKLLSLGYTQAEIDAALPANWQAVTLRQVLQFAASRRLKPRYDAPTDTIVCDGPIQPVKALDIVDNVVN